MPRLTLSQALLLWNPIIPLCKSNLLLIHLIGHAHFCPIWFLSFEISVIFWIFRTLEIVMQLHKFDMKIMTWNEQNHRFAGLVLGIDHFLLYLIQVWATHISHETIVRTYIQVSGSTSRASIGTCGSSIIFDGGSCLGCLCYWFCGILCLFRINRLHTRLPWNHSSNSEWTSPWNTFWILSSSSCWSSSPLISFLCQTPFRLHKHFFVKIGLQITMWSIWFLSLSQSYFWLFIF